MIGLDQAGARYGQRWIFRNLDLAVPPGRCLAVLGPNGRGKTTLVRALLGFLPLAEGSRTAPEVIGYVPQSAGREVAYAVTEMVAMGRVARRGLFAQPSSSDRAAAIEALAAVGIESLAGSDFDRLSGGERQLVLLARALATGADTLVLDEPASALDLRNQDRFLAVLQRLRKGGRHAIVFTTHLPQHAGLVADDILMMFGIDERLCGPAETVMTEASLARLYGIPVRLVGMPATAGSAAFNAVVPLFGEGQP